MPVTQTWTALPNGRDGDVLKLSAFVTLRLRTGDGSDALLAAFADVANWPTRVAGATFAVELDGNSVPASVTSSAPSPALWAALFPPNDTAVRSHVAEDYSANPVSSFAVQAALEELKKLHVAAGLVSPLDVPVWFGEQCQRRSRRLLEPFATASPTSTPAVAVAETVAFYRRQPDPDLPVTRTPPPTPDALHAAFDVHAILASLGDHPSLLRALGLVVDLNVAVADVPSPGESTILVRVRPSWTPTADDVSTPGSPATATAWDGVHFAAAGPEIDDGFLRLDRDANGEARYNLVDVDVEGGVLKAAHFANNLIQIVPTDGRPAPIDAGLPSLRSAGLSLVRDRRGESIAQVLKDNAQIDPILHTEPDKVVLSAEQLVRGYRLDVYDVDAGEWRSLCQRQISYHFVNDDSLDRGFTDIADEGFVQLAAASAAKPPGAVPLEPADRLYVHESVARWDGWSLVAARPGLAVNRSSDPASAPEAPAPTSGTSAGLESTVSAASNSLPRLRLGHGYRLRARIVDLAGNSPTRTDPSDAFAIPLDPKGTIYHRYDPVLAPLVVLTAPLGTASPGESLERVVIRTHNADESRDDQPADGPSSRHLAPPRTSVATAEACGVLDGSNGGPRADLYPTLVDRDGGQLPVDATSTPAVPLEPGDSFSLPYLPDPMARGAALRDLPATTSPTRTALTDGTLVTSTLPGNDPRPGSVTLIRYEDTAGWPDIAPFRLELAEGDGPPAWNGASRVLTVLLPKSVVTTTRVSSFVDESDLRLMGLWEWLREALEPSPNLNPADARTQMSDDRLVGLVSELAVEGGLWQLTPGRALTLVHAVQQPLGHPVIEALSADRDPGSSAAFFTGQVAVHGRSSASVTLRADWTDQLDDPASETLGVITGSADAFHLPIDHVEGGDILSGEVAIGTYDPITDSLRLGSGSSSSSPRHEFHDTRHHLVTYTPTSASRFREYFPADVAGGTSRRGTGVTVHVPSSRRPEIPHLRYAVPAFGWQRDEGTNLRVSRRQGGTLRVFLERPWFSSGDGELLGVVTWPGALSPDRRDQLSRFISQIGTDPVYDSSSRFPFFGLRFPAAVARESGLTLDELPGVKVDVAGHQPHFDQSRGLWTCDVRVEAGDVYHPWMHLALVRYQPNAIPDAKLSRVVLADFAALPMDRTALLTYDPFAPNHVAVTVSGMSYRATAGADGPAVSDGTHVEVSVERRVPGIADPVLGWEPADVAVTVDTDVRVDQVLWHGHVLLPTERAPGDHRIVIREFETLLVDRWLPVGAVTVSLPPSPAPRLVYADALVI